MGDIVGTQQSAWHSVPGACRARWIEIFSRTRTWLYIPDACPVCGADALHVWFWARQPVQLVVGGALMRARGSNWQWCSVCRSYTHSSGYVPAWFESDLDVDTSRLMHHPDVLEHAVQERLRMVDDRSP